VSSAQGAGRRVLRVRVKPRSSRAAVVEDTSGGATVSVHAPPDKGEANREALRLLADHFGLPLSDVRILRGASSPLKLVELSAGRRRAGAGEGKG